MGYSGLFFFIFVFSKVNKHFLAVTGFETTDLWKQKRSLYQLSRNPCLIDPSVTSKPTDCVGAYVGSSSIGDPSELPEKEGWIKF